MHAVDLLDKQRPQTSLPPPPVHPVRPRLQPPPTHLWDFPSGASGAPVKIIMLTTQDGINLLPRPPPRETLCLRWRHRCCRHRRRPQRARPKPQPRGPGWSLPSTVMVARGATSAYRGPVAFCPLAPLLPFASHSPAGCRVACCRVPPPRVTFRRAAAARVQTMATVRRTVAIVVDVLVP